MPCVHRPPATSKRSHTASTPTVKRALQNHVFVQSHVSARTSNARAAIKDTERFWTEDVPCVSPKRNESRDFVFFVGADPRITCKMQAGLFEAIFRGLDISTWNQNSAGMKLAQSKHSLDKGPYPIPNALAMAWAPERPRGLQDPWMPTQHIRKPV